MKKIIYLLLFLLSGIDGFSQFSNGGLINRVKEIAIRDAKFTMDYKDVEGSPYYTTDFIKGVAYLKDGNFASVTMRYDIYRDEIEFTRDKEIRWLKKNEINYVRYGSDMVILSHAVSDTSELGYFFLISGGEYRLLNKKIVLYYPLIPAGGYKEKVPAHFERENDEFYLQFNMKPAIKITDRKVLYTVFADNKVAMDFIKKEKVRVKTEDLKKLVTFLNSK